jgi:hypothetical protein
MSVLAESGKSGRTPKEARERAALFTARLMTIGALRSRFRLGPMACRWNKSQLSDEISERSNLTIRMQNRRFTRLTNGFSKKLENHTYSVALFVMFYNFTRIHATLRVTPAMAAWRDYRLWDVKDIVALVEADEAKDDRKRGPYKKRAA